MDQKKASIFRGAHRSIWTNIPRYSYNNTSVKKKFSPYFLLSSTQEVVPQPYNIKGLGRNNLMGALIPALMHWIHHNSVVKCAWARVVLGWVNFWEVLMLHPFFFFLDVISFINIHKYRKFIWFMFAFLGWVSCKDEEAIPNGIQGWGVSGTHRGTRVVHWLAVRIRGRRRGVRDGWYVGYMGDERR